MAHKLASFFVTKVCSFKWDTTHVPHEFLAMNESAVFAISES